jgi:hypothetical protein
MKHKPSLANMGWGSDFTIVPMLRISASEKSDDVISFA